MKDIQMACIKCADIIHPKRLEILPGTKTCVNCSTTTSKRGAPVMKGSGDHTSVELDIMEQDEFEAFLKTKNKKLS